MTIKASVCLAAMFASALALQGPTVAGAVTPTPKCKVGFHLVTVTLTKGALAGKTFQRCKKNPVAKPVKLCKATVKGVLTQGHLVAIRTKPAGKLVNVCRIPVPKAPVKKCRLGYHAVAGVCVKG